MAQRRVIVGLTINGRTHIYEGLNIAAQGTKFASVTQNECSVSIVGLNAETRNLLTGTKGALLTVEAGREGQGLFTLFHGDVIRAEVGLPPDLAVTIKAKTNNANNAKIVKTQGIESVQLSQLCSWVAENNGLKLSFEATDKSIGSYSYTGSAAKQLRDLADVGEVSVFVDEGVLVVKDQDKTRQSLRRILNMDSGMVGLPRATDTGVDVTYLIDGESLLGGQITIESKFMPSLSGDYIIDQLKFDARTHSDEFFYIASCRRL